MPAHTQTIAQYLATYSPRWKPSDHLDVDEYLERALSMISDCYNLALWEQNDRKIFRGMINIFPKFNGYAPLRLAVQTTKGANASTAVTIINREVGLLVGLREPKMLTAALRDILTHLNRCQDVKLLDIPKRLDALHELFRTSPNFTLKPPVVHNEILADLPFVEAPDKNYTYLRFADPQMLTLDGVGVLGEQPEPKKWRAVAYTGFDMSKSDQSHVQDFETKAQAIEWGKEIIDNDPMIIQHTAESISMYPTQNIIVVRIKKIEDTTALPLNRNDTIEEAAVKLRTAQKAYMLDRGNETLGKAVGLAAKELDNALALKEMAND